MKNTVNTYLAICVLGGAAALAVWAIIRAAHALPAVQSITVDPANAALRQSLLPSHQN